VARKRQPSAGGSGCPQPSARARRPDPDLKAAAAALRRALKALGDGDPASRMARSALSNVEQRLAGAPVGQARQPALELRRAADGGRWQIWSGQRVLRSYPAACSHRDAWLSANAYAFTQGRSLLDRTTAADRERSPKKRARRLPAAARRVLAVLQAVELGGRWVERDWLLGQAAIPLPDEELDTRIGAAADLVSQLRAAGHQVEHLREATGDFYRLRKE